ncbi:MAG: hypothetical protein NTZ73_02535 [Candidatus Diapherotrites archaeon]|nr:hypothetical protein [Candidatus Diapherotrites archaeon]
MSLADMEDDDYVAVSRKRGGGISKGLSKGAVGNPFKIILLIIVLAGGILIGHYFVTPFMCGLDENYCTVQPKICIDCLSAKKILGSENQCLHKYVSSQELLDICSKS